MLTAIVATFEPSSYPPFPHPKPTIELETISLAKIQEQDQSEFLRLLRICKTHGFFYLNFSNISAKGIVEEGVQLARLAEGTFARPLPEKQRFLYQPGTIFGYKQKGLTMTNAKNTPDAAEFFNTGKDDILRSRLTNFYPLTINAAQPLLKSFIHTAHATGLSLLSALFAQLGVDPSQVLQLHRISEFAGSQVRLTYGPPRQQSESKALEIQTPAHTDFGSITLLFDWLGGLQLWSASSRGEKTDQNVVDPTDSDGHWQWVKPKPGMAIVNLGEAAAVFTGGVLCAGRHRVLPAPGEQGAFGRYSVVYFVRPEDQAVMRRFQGERIPEWKTKETRGVGGMKVKEWVLRQSQGLRKVNPMGANQVD